jgi:hypothetical protein
MVKGGRLGMLLAESFERRWRLGERQRMGQVRDFGLILNTTLAGRLRRGAGVGEASLADVAGGRLVLTNLALREAFPQVQLPFVPEEPLPVIVDDPATGLDAAAALSANFAGCFRTRRWTWGGGRGTG